MKILVSGSHGLIGSSLVSSLEGEHEVIRLVRSSNPSEPSTVGWDPAKGEIAADGLEGLDAVVHLAGENIAEGRWTDSKKRRIRDSRVDGTQLLCQTLAALSQPPKTLVCASAVGFYGDRGDEVLDETSPEGTGFLSEVCREWEAACDPARAEGIRVVNTRFGMVLSPRAGALAKMLLPFKLGVGGIVGSGRQYWSWITLSDAVQAVRHALDSSELRGPVNAVTPHPVTNREFTKSLGRVLRRPTVFPVPALGARIVLGEMANELLIPSTRAIPKRLQETNFEFADPELEAALFRLLNRS